jgi:UDP-N-acetyl-D-glucosamine/UDP-N-acetyl-D-galactosamine dehydrogenase
MNLSIIGAGYVGLPLAIAFSKFFKVQCFDIDVRRIKELKSGNDLNNQHSKKEIKNKKLIFSCDPNTLKNSDIFIITVPTPINKNNQPDLKMLKNASIMVAQYIKKNSIVIYESTTYPGCTEDYCVPLIEKYSNLKCDKDFEIAYSPERVNPGDKINTLKSITKIVSARNDKTLNKVKKLYKLICKSIYDLNNIKVAESAKVIENTQRDINIALVNEFSVIFNKLNISTNEVLKAASTKWNFHYYKPGLVGGHCISVDPYYLSYEAKRKNYNPKIILLGRKFNENMPSYVFKQIKVILKKNQIIKKINICILGFSFKENIPDIRNTKISKLIKFCKEQGFQYKVYDSLVSKKDVFAKHGIKIYNFKEIKKSKFDIIILAVPHKEFIKNLTFYNQFYKNSSKKIFFDLKNIYLPENLVKNNFKYFQL